MRTHARGIMLATAALLLLAGGAGWAQEPGLFLHLDFNQVQDGHYADLSPARLRAPIFGAEPCEGVNGYGVRIPGGRQSVNVDLPAHARNLEALTVAAWVSPDDPRYANLVVGHNEPWDPEKLPFMLRWRTNWEFWFQLTAADGERRLLLPGKPCLDSITRPQRKWVHVAGTYDGETSILYVNGQVMRQVKWPTGRKALAPVTGLVQIGGRGEAYKGCLDEVRLYNRALSAEEIQALVQARENYRPAIPPGQEKQLPGTLDGQPFNPEWQRIVLPQGYLTVSNNGLLTPHSAPPGPWINWGFFPLDLQGQRGRAQNYFSEVSGNLETRADGSASLSLTGKTTHNLHVNQALEVSPEGDVRVRWEVTGLANNAPPPVINWPMHLWPSAMRFVSHDDQGLVTGNLMDLDGELRLRGLTEINLVRGGIRLVLGLGPGTIHRVTGSRDPRRWLGGYTSTHTEFLPEAWKSWAETQTAVLELALRLEPDNLPPRLDRAQAREVTRPVPFDFSGLYAIDPKTLQLVPHDLDLPVWLEGEQVAFQVSAPAELREQARTCAWTLAEAFTGAQTAQGTLPSAATGQTISFPAPPGGAYVLKLQALDGEQKPVAEATAEVIIAGEIPQRKMERNQRLPLRKVEEVDFAQADPGHDFFSFSGASQVVGQGRTAYRRTLTYPEAFERGGSTGAGVCDWFGVRFKTEPGKIYVLETEYPDLDGMSISLYLNEPQGDPTDEQTVPITRTASGLFTGGYLPHDNTLKTFQCVHFASAPWVTVSYQDAHHGRPGTEHLPPCCIKRATLYEVVNGDLPALDAPVSDDRLLGVHCESGGLALCSFSPEKLRGENGNYNDAPAPGEYYRYAYRAVANLIRYMRYRGDNALYFGVYRYRSACFPSRTFPPSSGDSQYDLPGLMARMFERNGLKLGLVAMPCNPLPTARLHEYSRWDVAQGAPATLPVDLHGNQTTFSPYNPSANPFNEQVVQAYASLARELGQRYGKYPAVGAIGFISGSAWWEPCLPFWISGPQDTLEAQYLRTTYDDDTMRRFGEWAHLSVPGEGEAPDRFKVRHDWIMAHAKEKYIEFRGYATAQTQLALAKALREAAPKTDYLFMDYYGAVFNSELVGTPLEACQLAASAPQYLRGPGFVHMPYLPQANGATLWEHGRMKREWMPQVAGFLTDDMLAQAWDTSGRSGRYIHRQFYEQGLKLPAGRSWVWDPQTTRLSTCSYPQEGGRGYLADFALALARGTPNHVSYMWCDSTTPLGHEPEHQEFARLFRSLPAGHYQEASRANGVFCRYLTRPAAVYVVNTNGQAVTVDLKTGLAGKFTEVNTDEEVTFDNAQGTFDLEPYEMKVYVIR